MGDKWVVDLNLPLDEDTESTEWIQCAVAGERVVALRDDAFVADLDGDASPRFFDAKRCTDPTDLFALDPSVTPARPTLITTELDRSTWVLEGARWRRVKSKVPDGDLVACLTSAGLFVLSERELWRVTADGWTAVATFAAPDGEEGEEGEEGVQLVPACLAFDPSRGLLLGATGASLVALGAKGWTRVSDAPGALVQLAIDPIGDRIVAATKSATFGLALAPLGLSGWLPGGRRVVAMDFDRPNRLEPTAEVVEPPDRAVLGIKRGERVLALLPPNLAVLERTSGFGLRVTIVAADVLPPAPVLLHPKRLRLVVCSVVADESEQPSGDTRAGGDPDWIQNEEVPTCRRCDSAMRFRAQLCEDLYDCWFGDAGRLYVFACAAGCGADVVVQC